MLLQSVCVAVTYIYFTNELKQVGAGPGRRGPGGELLLFLRQVTVSLFLLHGVCKRGSRAQLRARPPPLPPPPPDVPQTAVTRPTKAEGGAAPLGASCSIGQSRRAQSDLRQRAANAASPQHGPPCAARSRARCSCPRCTAGPRVCRRTQQKVPACCLRRGSVLWEGGRCSCYASCCAPPDDGTAELHRFHFVLLRNTENENKSVNIGVQFRALLSPFPLHKTQDPTPEFCTASQLH